MPARVQFLYPSVRAVAYISCSLSHTLIVVYDVSKVVASTVVRLADRHGIVGKVYIAIVAKVYYSCQS